MDMGNMSKIQYPYRDEKCLLKATHGSSMNDEKTLTLLGELQLAQNIIIHSYSEIVASIYPNNIK